MKINKTQISKKISDGELARKKWAKSLNYNDAELDIDTFNKKCGGLFVNAGRIILDDTKRQSTIQVIPKNKKNWNEKVEKIYIIVRNSKIIKIGGSRNGMKQRFTSYLCGHHVTERGKSGKMSVTNAHIYHTIEKDLIETESIWEFYVWKLPIIQHTINILGYDTTIISQTYHAYESCCIKKYKSLTKKLPLLCDNCDPTY
jgi:hypothetical protein